jgi:hypothetical protein
MLENARIIARAEFDLADIRCLKAGLICHTMAFGQSGAPRSVGSLRAERILQAYASTGLETAEKALKNAFAMPTTEPERTSQAVILAELMKLDRYERRAAARRDRALRTISNCRNARTNNL